MRLLISNIPDGADISYIIDCIHRAASDDITIEQVPDSDPSYTGTIQHGTIE